MCLPARTMFEHPNQTKSRRDRSDETLNPGFVAGNAMGRLAKTQAGAKGVSAFAMFGKLTNIAAAVGTVYDVTRRAVC